MGSGDSQETISHKENAKTGRIWPDWYPQLLAFKKSDNRQAAWQLVTIDSLWLPMVSDDCVNAAG